MKKSKPNKRQKAILSLLDIIEAEGLHYGIVSYGVNDELKAIKDERLTKLVDRFVSLSNEIENILEELSGEVVLFLDDDSDF
jgi:hypothetical protein